MQLLPLPYKVFIFEDEESVGRYHIDFYLGADAGLTGASHAVGEVFRAWG